MDKALLFVLLVVIGLVNGWVLVMIGVPTGVFFGVMEGISWERKGLRDRLAQSPESIPPWLSRMAGSSSPETWNADRRWSIAIGVVMPVTLFILQFCLGGSWAEFSFPVSVLSAWVLSVCIIELFLVTKVDKA